MMTSSGIAITKKLVYRWLIRTFLLLLFFTTLAWVCTDAQWAQSFLLGGLLQLLPEWLVAWIWLGGYQISHRNKLSRTLYMGEAIKLFFIGVLFVLFLKYLSLRVSICLFGWMSTQICFLLITFLGIRKHTASASTQFFSEKYAQKQLHIATNDE